MAISDNNIILTLGRCRQYKINSGREVEPVAEWMNSLTPPGNTSSYCSMINIFSYKLDLLQNMANPKKNTLEIKIYKVTLYRQCL